MILKICEIYIMQSSFSNFIIYDLCGSMYLLYYRRYLLTQKKTKSMTLRYYIITFLFFNLGYGQYHHQKTWSTYIGIDTTSDQTSYTIDSQNNLIEYTNLKFSSSAPQNYYTNLATANAFQPQSGGGASDFLLTKISPQGTLLWATYYGGDGSEARHAVKKSIAIDSQDNIYIIGATSSTTGMITSGAFLTTPSPIGVTSFMTKFSPSGTREWCTYLYGSVSEIAIDITDTIFVSGITNNTSGVATTGAFLETSFCCAPNNDPVQSYRNGYINSFNKQGNRIAGTYTGKVRGVDYSIASNGLIQNNYGYNITLSCDPSGNIYICGDTSLQDENTGYYASTGCYDSDYNANSVKNYISKFNKNLTQRIWSTYYSGSVSYGQFRIKAATATDLYFMSGVEHYPEMINPANFTSAGCFQSNFAGLYDLYLVKFNTDGQREWATLFGGNDIEYSFDLNVKNNKLYLGGGTGSNNITTTGVYQESFIGGGSLLSDGFFCEFSTSGQRNWCSYFGGDKFDTVAQMIPFGNDSFYVVGGTASTTNISTPNSLQPNINLFNSTHRNSFIARFDNIDLKTSAFSKSKISLYPNPNKGVFILSGIASLSPNQNLVVVDMQGRVVYKTPITSLDQKFEFQLVSGMYLAKVMVANEDLQTIKFMVE